MPAPFELQALAHLRSRLHAPTFTVFVTDDWGFATKLEDLGCLAIRVHASQDHDCDWSPIAGLHVILAQWRTALAKEMRLASALLAARPALFETLRRSCWGDVVYDADGAWKENLQGRRQRGELLLKLSLS